MQEFERHEKLKKHILRMATTGSVGSPSYWDDFISSLNEALSSVDPAQSIPENNWDYYQNLIKQNGHEGITDLLVKLGKAPHWVEIDSAEDVQSSGEHLILWDGCD